MSLFKQDPVFSLSRTMAGKVIAMKMKTAFSHAVLAVLEEAIPLSSEEST